MDTALVWVSIPMNKILLIKILFFNINVFILIGG